MTPAEHDAYVDELKAWLRAKNMTRETFAADLGAKKGTLDNWFSKGFPDWAVKSISRLRNPTDDSGGLEVTFTAKEFELIEQARKLTGLPTRGAYYQAAINEYTDQILSAEQSASKEPASSVIKGQFTQEHQNIAAEKLATGTDPQPVAKPVSYTSGIRRHIKRKPKP